MIKEKAGATKCYIKKQRKALRKRKTMEVNESLWSKFSTQKRILQNVTIPTTSSAIEEEKGLHDER